MFRSVVLVVVIGVLLTGCELSTAPTSLTAAEILRRSDEAMARLTFFRATVDIRPTVSARPATTDVIELHGPVCLRNAHGVLQPQTASANCPCGWSELASPYRPYFRRAQGGILGGPPYAGATPATNLRIEGTERHQGVQAWALSYEFKTPSIEGPFTIWGKEWVAVDTFLLLRQEQRDNDRFGVRAQVTSVLFDFDGPRTKECT